MAAVTLDIGGRQYTIACRDGGEDHLHALARRVDAKVEEAREAVGNASEVRQLLFASLLLADDLAENNPAKPSIDPASMKTLSTLAARMEAIADALESGHINA